MPDESLERYDEEVRPWRSYDQQYDPDDDDTVHQSDAAYGDGNNIRATLYQLDIDQLADKFIHGIITACFAGCTFGVAIGTLLATLIGYLLKYLEGR